MEAATPNVIDRGRLLPRSGIGVDGPWLVIAPPGNPIIRQLLDAGADVNARNVYQGTALMIATGKFGHVRTVQLLLDAGADPNLRDKYGHTALWYAKSHRAAASVRELERAGGIE